MRLRVVGVVHVLAVLAVCAAPRASASTNSAVLNWTGLRDTYGVPIGDYYLSIASTSEAIAHAGPGPGWDPASWADWTMRALALMSTRWSVAWMLTCEAGLFVGIIAIALVILRITVSTYWLTVIGEIARAISTAVIQVTTELGLLLIAIPVGVFAGVVTVRRGEAGRGATMILIALALPALSVAVFADPAGEMYGNNGLLAFARRVGFSVAEAATHNGPVGAITGLGGQVDALTASLITHTVREPLQLWNFGHVVDHLGSCGTAWSTAVLQGAPDGPLHAMGGCGDRAALAYGQQLDGTNIWIGLVFVFAAALLGLFVVVSGWAVLRVSVKAIWTTVVLLPALWLGAIPGAPQRRAMAVVGEFFRHGIEAMVYIVYVSVIGLAIERLVSQPLPGQLGGTNPFAHVLIMAAASLGALFLLRHVGREMSSGKGVLGRVGDIALGVGVSAGMRGVSSRLRARRDPPQIDVAPNASRVHGTPRDGWEPVLQGGELGGGRHVAAVAAGPAGAGAVAAKVLVREVVRRAAEVGGPETQTADDARKAGGPASPPTEGVDGSEANAVPPVAGPTRGNDDISNGNDQTEQSEHIGPEPDSPVDVDPVTGERAPGCEP